MLVESFLTATTPSTTWKDPSPPPPPPLLPPCLLPSSLLRKPVREKRTIISRNIRAIDMHDCRTDDDNLLGSATQSNSTDPPGVYNTCLRQLLDRHAPLVTRTVTDRTSVPWMTLEIKQAKVQRRLAERKWRESGLAVHREIYVKQRNLVSNMINKAKKDYLCHKVVNCGSSRELFHLNSQMMGKCGDTMLPSNISPESLPDKFNEFMNSLYIRLKRSDAALTLTDQSPLIQLNSLAQSL